MIVSFVSLLAGDCRTCMKDILAAFHSWVRIRELLELGTGVIGKRELHALIEKYLMIEAEAERRFAEMVKMTDDVEIKNMLVELLEAKKRRYQEGRRFIDMLEKTYGKMVEAM